MERDMNQSAASIPTVCRGGCGFYGSSSTEGLCSKCFKDALKRKQDPTRHSTAGSATPTPSSVPVPSTSATGLPGALTTINNADAAESPTSTMRYTSTTLNKPGDLLNNKMCATSHFTEETRDNCPAPTTIMVTAAPTTSTTNDIFEHSTAGANDIPSAKVETSSSLDHVTTTNKKSPHDELTMPPQQQHTSLTATTSAADVTSQKSSSGGDQSVSSATVVADPDLHKSSSFPSQKPNRCYQCSKKVGFTGFDCRCGFIFCGVHRYSDMHNCAFDYKSMGADEIRKANPVVQNEKIQKL